MNFARHTHDFTSELIYEETIQLVKMGSIYPLLNIIFNISFYILPFILIISRFVTLSKYYTKEPLGDKYRNLKDLVGKCSAKIGIKTPEMYIIQSKKITPFVFGITNKNAKIVFSEECAEECEKKLGGDSRKNVRWIETVLLHELSHIKNKDVAYISLAEMLIIPFVIWIMLMIISDEIQYVLFAQRAHLWLQVFRYEMIGSLLAFYLVTNSVSRLREFLADARVSHYFGVDEGARRIFNANLLLQLGYCAGKPGSKLSLMPNSKMRYIYYYTIADHPSLHKRKKAILKSEYLGQDKIQPFYETAIFIGIAFPYIWLNLSLFNVLISNLFVCKPIEYLFSIHLTYGNPFLNIIQSTFFSIQFAIIVLSISCPFIANFFVPNPFHESNKKLIMFLALLQKSLLLLKSCVCS